MALFLFSMVDGILVQSDELEEDVDGSAKSGTIVDDAEGTGSSDGDELGNTDDSYSSKVIAIFFFQKVCKGNNLNNNNRLISE